MRDEGTGSHSPAATFTRSGAVFRHALMNPTKSGCGTSKVQVTRMAAAPDGLVPLFDPNG
jgi:hypothetical protein